MHPTHADTASLLALAFQAGRLGSWRWDRSSGRVTWDARLEEIFGFERGEFDGTYDAYVSRLHPDERGAVRAEVELAMAERRPYLLEHRIVWPDGTVRWIEGVGQPIVDDADEVLGTFGCVADVTDRVVAEADRAGVLERLDFLARAGEVLNRSLDVRETLAKVVSLTVPRLADAAVLFVTDDHGPQLVAARHADEMLDGVLGELFTRYPFRAEGPGMGAAMTTGEIQLVPDVPDELLTAAAHDAEHLAILRRLQIGAGIAVPLLIDGHVRGVLGLGLRHGRQVTDDLVQTAAALSSRAAIALENSRLHGTVKTIADALQAGLAPVLPPSMPGMHIAAEYVAAGAGVQVGGDFYDLVDRGNGAWSLVVGDVCGRGPGAAALNAQVRFAARALARMGLDVGRVATALNANVVADAEAERFCTAVIATLTPQECGISVELVSAGHPGPLVRRADGALEQLGGADPLLGIVADASYAPERTHLAPGDVLVVVTDGVLEARDADGAFFEQARLCDAIAQAPRGAANVAKGVRHAVEVFAGAVSDDLAVVVIEAVGPRAADERG